MSKVYVAFVEGGHAGLYKGQATATKTPGKETPVIKSLGRRIQEEEFNEPTAAMLIEELKRCGVHVYDCAPGADDVPLNKRTDYANKIYWQYCSKYGKANVIAVYISIHFNALDGKFDGNDPSGFSLHIYPGSKTGRELANDILGYLKEGTKQVNRGIKENDFHVVRETVMPAVLSENGFMDNQTEAALMLDKQFQQEVAIEHAKGICKYFGIPYKEEPQPAKKPPIQKTSDSGVMFRVVTGSFKDRANAEERAKALKAKGFESFIDVIK